MVDSIFFSSNWLLGEPDSTCDGSKLLFPNTKAASTESNWLVIWEANGTSAPSYCSASGEHHLIVETSAEADGDDALLEGNDSRVDGGNCHLFESATADLGDSLFGENDSCAGGGNCHLFESASGVDLGDSLLGGNDSCAGGGNCHLFESASGVDLGDSLLGGCVLGDRSSCVEATASGGVRGNCLLLDCSVSDSI